MLGLRAHGAHGKRAVQVLAPVLEAALQVLAGRALRLQSHEVAVFGRQGLEWVRLALRQGAVQLGQFLQVHLEQRRTVTRHVMVDQEQHVLLRGPAHQRGAHQWKLREIETVFDLTALHLGETIVEIVASPGEIDHLERLHAHIVWAGLQPLWASVEAGPQLPMTHHQRVQGPLQGVQGGVVAPLAEQEDGIAMVRRGKVGRPFQDAEKVGFGVLPAPLKNKPQIGASQ